MAQVQYTVFYRGIHPLSNKPITNKQGNYKPFTANTTSSAGGSNTKLTTNSRFREEDIPKDSFTGKPYTLEQYIPMRNNTTESVFDMLFVFDSVADISGKLPSAGQTYEIKSDTFRQVKGDPWFIASVTGSLEAAMTTAKRLIQKIGKDNVKVTKNVPIGIEVGIE